MGVLYVFHQNTNLSREAGAVGRRRDLRVGVLACRTPHRPNPVGLSLARVLHVDAKAGRVTLGGLDVVDGTPCLDLKPYLPSYEALPDATVPYWVEASYKEPLMRVEWSPSATTAFRALLGQDGEGGGSVRCKPFEDCDALRRALEGTLALDIRSSHQRDRHPSRAGRPTCPFLKETSGFTKSTSCTPCFRPASLGLPRGCEWSTSKVRKIRPRRRAHRSRTTWRRAWMLKEKVLLTSKPHRRRRRRSRCRSRARESSCAQMILSVP